VSSEPGAGQFVNIEMAPTGDTAPSGSFAFQAADCRRTRPSYWNQEERSWIQKEANGRTRGRFAEPGSDVVAL